MTTRARRPTDEVGTEIFDAERRHALLGGPGQRIESSEHDATEVTPRPGGPIAEGATPTHIDPLPAAPIAVGRAERSEPIRVVSMKDQLDRDRPRPDEARLPRPVQLRSMAEVARRGRADTPLGLGNLAPPRDPRQARARRVRANVVRAGVALGLACALAFAIWLIAGR